MRGDGRLRAELAGQLVETRRRTLALAALAREYYCERIHPFYSPMGWHLGHVGLTEWLWVLGRGKGEPSLRPELEHRFANVPANPREERSFLPPYVSIACYLEEVRERVLGFLE